LGVPAVAPAMIAAAAIAVAKRPVTARFVSIASPAKALLTVDYAWPGCGH
jgi:hypothetical protein